MSKHTLDIITLASAILKTRGSASIEDIKRALEDAKWVMDPRVTDSDYKDWQVRNGMTPTTKEEDQAKAKQVAEGMERTNRAYASRMQR